MGPHNFFLQTIPSFFPNQCISFYRQEYHTSLMFLHLVQYKSDLKPLHIAFPGLKTFGTRVVQTFSFTLWRLLFQVRSQQFDLILLDPQTFFNFAFAA